MSSLTDLLAQLDPSYYLANNPDVAAAGLDPRVHYAAYGAREGRKPSADGAAPTMMGPPPSTAPLDPSNPASMADWRQRAHDATSGINRMPYVAPSTVSLSADPSTVTGQFYPGVQADQMKALMKLLGLGSDASSAAQAGSAGGLTSGMMGTVNGDMGGGMGAVSNMGMAIDPYAMFRPENARN